MQKQKRKFSRQSTNDFSNNNQPPQKIVKIQRKPQTKLMPPINRLKSPNNKANTPKQQQSVISHLTKRSLFDRKDSQHSESRAKSLALKYKGKYQQPGVFKLDDQTFIDLYKNDPFAKAKIDYVIKKTDEKMKKNKKPSQNINSYLNRKIQQIEMQKHSRLNDIQQIITNNCYMRCKSQSDIIQAQECLRYKQLIVSNSQAYSGCTV